MKYSITSPDGQEYEIEGPANATNAQLIEQIQKSQEQDKGINWPRMGAEVLGGIAGGAAGMPAGPMGVLAGGGLGAEAGGQMYDLSNKFIGGAKDSRGLLDKGVDAAKNVGVNMIGQKVGGDVINWGGKQLSNLLKPGANRMMGGQAPDVINSFANANIRGPSAGTASGNRFLQTMEAALNNAPGSANYMRQYTDDVLKQSGDEASRIAQLAGGQRLSPQGASDTLAGGAKDAMRRFVNRRQGLGDELMSAVGRDTPIPTQNTQGLLSTMQAEKAAAPGMRSFMNKPIAETRGLLETTKDLPMGKDAIPYEAVRQARTNIGSKLETPNVPGAYIGLEGQQAKRVYGGLLEDLNAAATDAGKGYESRVLDRYTRYYNNVDKPTLEKLIDRDDKAYKWMMEGSKDSGARIAKARNNVTSKEWDDVVSTTVDRMGLATPGTQNEAGDLFSPNTFLTNWNKLSKEAKANMFSGKRYAGTREALDNLVDVTAALKDSATAKNFSNTAPVTSALNAISNPLTALTLGTAAVPQHLLAKQMTNPVFVNWLAKGAKIAPTNLNALKVHAAKIPTLIGAEYSGLLNNREQ